MRKILHKDDQINKCESLRKVTELRSCYRVCRAPVTDQVKTCVPY